MLTAAVPSGPVHAQAQSALEQFGPAHVQSSSTERTLMQGGSAALLKASAGSLETGEGRFAVVTLTLEGPAVERGGLFNLALRCAYCEAGSAELFYRRAGGWYFGSSVSLDSYPWQLDLEELGLIALDVITTGNSPRPYDIARQVAPTPSVGDSAAGAGEAAGEPSSIWLGLGTREQRPLFNSSGTGLLNGSGTVRLALVIPVSGDATELPLDLFAVEVIQPEDAGEEIDPGDSTFINHSLSFRIELEERTSGGSETQQTEPAEQTSPEPAPEPEGQSEPAQSSAGTGEAPSGNDRMIQIPASTFPMGSPEDAERARDNEHPQHEVSVGAFSIDRTPVTNDQYAYFAYRSGYQADGDWREYFERGETDDHPVRGLSYRDARRYCEWRGARLPTEAEWELAARGTDGRTWPWGNEFDHGHLVVGDSPSPVGSYPSGASPFGVLDMAGQVWEWTATPFHSYPYNPDLESAERMVMRGGSWLNSRDHVRTAVRAETDPELASLSFGVRCASEGGGGNTAPGTPQTGAEGDTSATEGGGGSDDPEPRL